jgi:hypothetical protein
MGRGKVTNSSISPKKPKENHGGKKLEESKSFGET